MINLNVGEMPLDIFADYISDILGQEWSWEYLLFSPDGYPPFSLNEDQIGVGIDYDMDNFEFVMDIYGQFTRQYGVHPDYNSAGLTHNRAFGCGNMISDYYGCGHDNY
jgi:hypothetical protein